MQIINTAICLTVDDVPASVSFLTSHFGFTEAMAADGFASLTRPDTPSVIFHRRGLEVLPEGFRDRHADGVILAFVVDDLHTEYERLRAEGVAITLEPREEPWGEKLFMVADPNGVSIELVEWATGAEGCSGDGSEGASKGGSEEAQA
ncbi:VOC family protein [Streptomyces bambusae]|uniref:Glyoxalase n=1 Tax=Streptomyces bambusae TaxID=1550616 RepID=A0ABS6YZG4_9ACTN|nr:VOC family protein [Streptomyces bambusae]MBW5480534.1 glyoxalase [Streptomyces bambusae]